MHLPYPQIIDFGNMVAINHHSVMKATQNQRIPEAAFWIADTIYKNLGIRHFELEEPHKLYIAPFKEKGKTKAEIDAELIESLKKIFDAEDSVASNSLKANNIQIMIKRFQDSTIASMNKCIQSIPLELFPITENIQYLPTATNCGEENEIALYMLIQYYLSENKRLDIIFKDNDKTEFECKDAVCIEHTGNRNDHPYGKADVVIHQANNQKKLISIKTGNFFSYDDSCFGQRDYFKRFTKYLFDNNIVTKTPIKNFINHFRCSINAGEKINKVCSKLDNENMHYALFGHPDGSECDSVIIGNIYAGFVEGFNIEFYPATTDSIAKLVIKVQKVVNNVNDVIGTDYEPILLMYKKSAPIRDKIINAKNIVEYFYYKDVTLSLWPRWKAFGHINGKPSEHSIMIEMPQ